MGATRERSSSGELTAAAYLRGLLEVAQLVRGEFGLAELLPAVARVVSETLGFETVVINLYRPDVREYEVMTVHGNERARSILLGNVTPAKTWEPQLDPRFLRRGAFFVPAHELDWDEAVASYTPQLAAPLDDDPDAWLADDALFVTLDAADGRRLGVISVDEPIAGRRPDDQLIDVLTAVAAHAAAAIESSHHVAQLQVASARHRAVIGASLDAVIAVDGRGRILEFNPAAERTFGYSAGEAVGCDSAQLLLCAEDRDSYRQGLARAFSTPDATRGDRRAEFMAVRADASRLPVELSLTLVQGSHGSEPIIYGFVRDISERRRGEEHLTYLAYHDQLTGLPNRILIEEQLDLAIARARRTGRTVALMFLDLDDFKAVNDRLGHNVGDQVLAAVATRLRSVLRDTDVLARQGGDEFLVLLSDLDGDPVNAAEAVSVKLHEALREPFVVAGAELRTGASIGVSLCPDDATDTEALLRHADAAMYRAKGAGGGQLAFHRQTDSLIARRASVAAQLQRAIGDSELELHYQPIWTLPGEPGAQGEIAGVEALLRWRHPDRGLLGPNSFITLAERSASGSDLVAWIVAQACGDAAAWQRLGLTTPVSLNASAHQLLASGLCPRLREEFERHGLDPTSFTIELTESAWTVDAQDTLTALSALRGLGVSLAIDDFGAGFSSLSRLHELEADAVKLDGRLLDGVPENRNAVAVLRAIVELARVGEATIVAEGVESHAQVAALVQAGVQYGQGFLLGAPLPAGELTPLLADRLRSSADAGDRAAPC